MTLHNTLQAIANAGNYPLQPDSMALLIKIPLTYITEYREIKLVPGLKLHSYGLVLIVLEDIVHATRKEKQSSILPGHKLCHHNNDPPVR